MPPADGPLSGSTLGRYRIGPLLGRGGMGEVYRGDDVELQRAVAIKVLPTAVTADASRLARFVQEARAASALNHPHLVSIYEIGQAQPDSADAPVKFIAMELVPGETLRRIIDGRRYDLKSLLEHLANVGDALSAAHAAGIVHRDLKPDNIMIADSGYAKVLDFGLAKLRPDDPLGELAANEQTMTRAGTPQSGSDAPHPTSPGVVMGTLGYMSPEQARGLSVDHRSDIFSFGCVLYEVATGTRPFKAATPIDTLHQIIHEQPRPIAQATPPVPQELQRIIRKSLAKSPDERYQSMKDLALDLRELRRDMDAGWRPGIDPPSAGPRSMHRLGWIAAAAILAAAAAGAIWMTTRSTAPAESRGGLRIERATASGLVIDAAISEDGNYIAYVEAYAGEQTLSLRQISGGNAIALMKTKGGFWGIAFSRDGKSIYYALKTPGDAGTLYAIPTLGGTPRALLKRIESPVTFSPDGARIAFFRLDPDQRGGSMLVLANADGTNERVLVAKSPPESLVPRFFTAPSWSPDGRWISAVVHHGQTRDAVLSLFDAETGAERPFPHRYMDATFTAWLPDGTGIMLIAQMPGIITSGNGGQLFIQPYPSGEVQRVTNDLAEYRTVRLTRDSRTLLTVASESNARLSVASIAGGDERRLPEDRFGGVGGMAWSPDGSRIYYAKATQRALQLWTMTIDGTDAREVVESILPSGIATTADGSIVYGAVSDGRAGIWRANQDGSARRLLLDDPDPRSLAAAPDGRSVYFTTVRDGGFGTYRLPIENGPPELVVPFLERAVPSPDGQLIAGLYLPNREATPHVTVLGAADKQVRHSNTDMSISSSFSSVDWTRDSRTLLFVNAERMNIWKQPALGGPREKLTNYSDLWVMRFAVSPDGKSLLLCRGVVVRDAVLMTNFR